MVCCISCVTLFTYFIGKPAVGMDMDFRDLSMRRCYK